MPAACALITLACLPAGCTQVVTLHAADLRRLVCESPPGSGPKFEPLPVAERVAVFGETDASPYRIGVGDTLQIWGDTDFLKGFGETSKGDVVGTRVKTDGQVYLPELGAVPAQGKTVIELQDDLRERLKKYKTKPFVSVDLLETRSQKFYVLGEVGSPGVYPVDGRVTLLEGLSAAGGPGEDADLESAYVVRHAKILPVSLADIVVRGDTSRNVRMQHGDLVFVPSLKDAEVYVLGEVESPGAVPMKDGRLTLTAALAAANGLDPETANPNVVRIFRGGWGNPTCYTIGACEAYRLGESIGLHPGDRILVAPTGLATFNRSLSLVQPIITATIGAALAGLGVAAATK